MAQLSDDCFAFGGPLLSVEAAEALIASRIPALAGAERVPLATALGRVLAEDLRAPLPLPPFFNSAVDGYAFRHADLAPAARSLLQFEGRVAAGHSAGRPLPPGTASRIFTGAPMPPGADTVVMQEDAEATAAGVLGAARAEARRQCPPGWGGCGAGRAGVAGRAAAAGARGRPRRRAGLCIPGGGAAGARGVFSTGDELATPGMPLGPAQTYDSNRFTLLAMLARLPVEATDLGILPDQADATAAALRGAAGAHDLLLTSGGVSTGEEDHVRAAIEQGGRLVFWRLAVKPGRPAAMGMVAGTPVVGLPGNPVAAVVTFLHLARPLVLRLAGAAAEPLARFPAQAGFSYRKKAGRREYVRVRLAPGTPLPVATKFEREGAGLLTSLTESDAFVELPEEVLAVAPGDRCRCCPSPRCSDNSRLATGANRLAKRAQGPKPKAPGKLAMARIADQVARGAAPARMEREIQAIVAGLLEGPDPEAARETAKLVIEELRDEMLAGVADTAAMLEDIEHPDAASVRAAERTMAAMRAACDALVEAHAAL